MTTVTTQMMIATREGAARLGVVGGGVGGMTIIRGLYPRKWWLWGVGVGVWGGDSDVVDCGEFTTVLAMLTTD